MQQDRMIRLRRQLAAAAMKLADAEDQYAREMDKAASLRPQGDGCKRAAQQARATSQRAREIAAQFADPAPQEGASQTEESADDAGGAAPAPGERD
ncbi:hypothetical protein ADK70_17690 [Streptomyces rimosus subsp. pseudoverticillatus]|nr:hypothetical protein ADK70_17690 [Streptomyces rimosus subsp. pseudoverticillatus]